MKVKHMTELQLKRIIDEGFMGSVMKGRAYDYVNYQDEILKRYWELTDMKAMKNFEKIAGMEPDDDRKVTKIVPCRTIPSYSHIGHDNFWRNLAALQVIDDGTPTSIRQAMIKPVSKAHKRLHWLLGHWVTFAGAVFGIFTLKIAIEQILRNIK